MKNWLRVYKFPEVERTTYDRYECTAEHQIYPYIGNKPVGDVTPADIKKLLTKHMNAGYAFTTSKKAYSLLKMFFKQLYQEGAIPNNPMAMIDMTKKDNYLAAQNKENKPQCDLGDLITVLLDNALPLENLIPTGYARPEIKNSAVNSCTLSDENGKIGVGGFAGSLTGTTVADCSVKNCSNLTVKADQLGGGFAGVTRDAIIKGTLSGLGVEVAEALHPQSELIRCAIESSDISVEGGSYLGGFSGALANSYGINDTIDAQSSVKVSGTGDYAGGFTGYAMLGTLFGMGSYLVDSSDLLGTVKGLVTGLLGYGSDQELLDLGGVAPSAIMGCQINGDLTVAAQGSYAGGIVGRGNGVMITSCCR